MLAKRMRVAINNTKYSNQQTLLTSVLPNTRGVSPGPVASSVTMANGSDVPLPIPATFFNFVALRVSCNFSTVIFVVFAMYNIIVILLLLYYWYGIVLCFMFY